MDERLCEIRLFAGSVPPANWAFCDGQLLAISEYPALFSLFKNTFGGDGTTNFSLPKLDPPIENLHYMMCVAGAYPDIHEPPLVPGLDRGDTDPSDFIGYIGEIRMFPLQVEGFMNEKWRACKGQTLNGGDIYYSLFVLIGNKFGGTNLLAFGLPNLPSNGLPIFYAICLHGKYPTPATSQVA